MVMEEEIIKEGGSTWQPLQRSFRKWIEGRENILEPGLVPEPIMKVLCYLALYDAGRACTYDEIRQSLKEREVIHGNIPDNTLRTSVLNLGKTLEKFNHPFELKSFRGRFQLVPRTNKSNNKVLSNPKQDPIIIEFESQEKKVEEIAYGLIEKGKLPFYALYFLECSARWWENYSNRETELRSFYEADAWEKLGIKDRLFHIDESQQLICFVGLAPGEGLAEVQLLKKILDDHSKRVHYIAIDSSYRLLRNHIYLLKETLVQEIKGGRLLFAGVAADIFMDLQEPIEKVKQEFVNRGIFESENDFLPLGSSMLVTYLGNCLGNNSHDQETEIFTKVYSSFTNRPLEFLLSVSVMRPEPDEYKRNLDDFILQTPKYLLESTRLLASSRLNTDKELPEFNLPIDEDDETRLPSVAPEPYLASHQITGQIYRFYYKLAFDLSLSKSLGKDLRPLPKGTMIFLCRIIKYDIKSLVQAIEKCGLFKIKYDSDYHQVVNSGNGIREMAVFSAYLEK